MVKTFVSDRVSSVLATNKDGTKQFGLRDQSKKIKKDLGVKHAVAYLQEHISVTLRMRDFLARPNSFVLCDTETTNVGNSAEVCEFGMVSGNGEVLFGEFVKPKTPISSGSTAIHGITNQQVSGCPCWSEISQEILRLLNTHKIETVVWYNGEFDLRVCNQSSYAARCPNIRWPDKMYDPIQDFASWIGDWNAKQNGWRWPKLEGGHRATQDCLALLSMMQQVSTSDVQYANDLIQELSK